MLSQHALQVVSKHALQQVSGGGVCAISACLATGLQGGSAPRGVSAPGGLWRPPGTATAAGGTHPTGMHSFFCA